MAGKITTNSVVLGDSITDTQNFVLKTNADGTATLARGALGGLGTVLTVDASSNVTLQKNISVGGATPSASGSGITFPATQSASSDANTLDDYEEGTFTPTLNFGGASVGIVYTFQQARYTKVGNVVTVQIYIALSSKGTSVGHAGVSALPFASSATLNSQIYTAQGDTLNTFLAYLPGTGSTALQLYTAATTSQITNTSFTGGDNLRFTIMYLV